MPNQRSSSSPSPGRLKSHRFTDGQDVKFLRAVEAIVANCGEPFRDILSGHRFLTREVVVFQLSRTTAQRQRYELGQVLYGRRPFSTKTKVFDTTGYGEVASRLGRAGGYINKAAKTLLRLVAGRPFASGQEEGLKELTAKLLGNCGTLSRLIRQANRDRPVSEINNAKGTRWQPARSWDDVPLSDLRTQDIRNALSHADAFVEKCVRDLPRMKDTWPSRAQTHTLCVRLYGMLSDLWRIVCALEELRAGTAACRRIQVATHVKPDVDALMAVWLVERYLFADDVDVVFVPYEHDFAKGRTVDCLLDMAGLHDPTLLLFDHKPPAFADRNQTCAARLVWDHLTKLGKPVGHLEGLVETVHAGDSPRLRRRSPLYETSRRQGLHHEFYRLREIGRSDLDLYRAVRRWLDRHRGL